MKFDDERNHRRLIRQGMAERTGVLTLSVAAPSTTLVDARLRFDSPVILVPTTANAAAEIGNGSLWIPESGRVNGSVMIVHASNALADRTFRYLIG